MDRKGIIAVALSLVTLVAWMYYNSIEMKKGAEQRARVQAAAVEAAALIKAAEPAAPAAAQAPTAQAPVAAPSAEPAAPEKLESLGSASADYTFSNLGGGIAKATLKSHEAERGTKMTLNEFGSVPIGAVTEVAGDGTGAPFAASVDGDGGTVTFERTDARQIQLTKKFTVPKSTALDQDYIVNLDVTFTNRSSQPVNVPGYFVHTGAAAPVHQRDMPTYTGFKFAGGKFIDVTWFQGGWFSSDHATFTAARENIAWAAVADQYFTTLITPQVTAQDPAGQAKQRGASVWAKPFVIQDDVWKATGRSTEGNTAVRRGIYGALGMPAFALEPGQSLTQSFRIYAGPREYGRLRLFPNEEADVLGFSDVGGLFAFLGPFIGLFSKLLLFSLNSLHAWVGSYAVAIIILTLIIKALLWPMQTKANRSMKRMQLLQPKMTEIREKYKDDPARMNTEVMKLYKDYGVNPLGGCLPALLQMPIFFGFYNMLGKAVELRNSKFLWVHDLSLPDTIFQLPGFGFPVNVLPLCMAATMFWQMSASPKSGDPTQQKMLMFMPLIFVMFCYNYASALALYLTVQNLVSVLQLYATRNQAPPTLQKKLAPGKKK